MNKKFSCDSCNQTFGRKWNALRHKKSVHNNFARIKNEKINPQISYKFQNKYYHYEWIFKILNQFDINSYHSPYENYSYIFSVTREDVKIIKIINQLIKPFNELEELLKHFDERIKALILLKSFDASLETNNPVRFMNETVETFRSIDGIKKIAEYMQQRDNKLSEDPLSNIKNKIMDSYIFKMQNN